MLFYKRVFIYKIVKVASIVIILLKSKSQGRENEREEE